MGSERTDAGNASSAIGYGGTRTQSSEPLDYDDPAYASQAFQYPALGRYAQQPSGTTAVTAEPTRYGPVDEPPERPRRSNTFWLWVIGLGALVVIIALVVTLFIVISNNDERQTPVIVPTAPSTSRPSTTPVLPSLPPIPSFPLPQFPTHSPRSKNEPATEKVVYDVNGTGTALTIMYYDGTLVQTEFNVQLPWHKEVMMAKNQLSSTLLMASAFPRQITCSMSINGALQGSGSSTIMCNPITN